jgi:hypothetical protein
LALTSSSGGGSDGCRGSAMPRSSGRLRSMDDGGGGGGAASCLGRVVVAADTAAAVGAK